MESLPRMRGDRPPLRPDEQEYILFTPHARGSTSKAGTSSFDSLVYPACAGIDRLSPPPDTRSMGLPRMRGDRPIVALVQLATTTFTPHARGSTLADRGITEEELVYPACAGIDLAWISSFSFAACLPRMRGDRPLRVSIIALRIVFTPHARGSTSCR